MGKKGKIKLEIKVKNKKIMILVIVFVILLLFWLITSYLDSARVRSGKEPKYAIRMVSNDGNKVTYLGLGYKVILYPSVSPNEPYKNNKGVKYGNWFMKYDLSDILDITLEEINEKVNNYYLRDDVDSSNMSYWGIVGSKIEVGMIDISKNRQNEFIDNIFSDKESKYLKDNNIFIFVEIKDEFDAEVIEVEENRMLVKVLKESKLFKKNDKVSVSITKSINKKYVSGNKVKIIYNGMVETSDPPQIGAYKIKLITK